MTPSPSDAGTQAVCLVVCTFPDRETAHRIGREMVEARHAACVNLLPEVESIYHWKGEIEEAGEVMAFFKTTESVRATLEAARRTAHPYETPEIIALPVNSVLPAYLAWVTEETGRQP